MDLEDKQQDGKKLKIKKILTVEENVVDPFKIFREKTMASINRLEPKEQERFFRELDSLIQLYYLTSSLNENNLPNVSRDVSDYLFEVLYLLLTYELIE